MRVYLFLCIFSILILFSHSEQCEKQDITSMKEELLERFDLKILRLSSLFKRQNRKLTDQLEQLKKQSIPKDDETTSESQRRIEEEIKALFLKYSQLVKTGDYEGASKYWSEDGILVIGYTVWLKGRSEIKSHLKKALVDKGVYMVFTPTHFEGNSDYQVVFGDAVLFQTDKNGTASFFQSARTMTHFKYNSSTDQWIVVSGMDTMDCKATSLKYEITKQWNSSSIDHAPVKLELSREGDFVLLQIDAPFFNDPPNPGGNPGEPFFKLWEYEVVEAFFLGGGQGRPHYLEVEFSPHGQHLILLLKGVRNAFKHSLPVDYTSQISGSTWTGLARIPLNYFPPNVTMFNAYAIHGSGAERRYEALYPTEEGKYTEPDFHRLEYFQPIDFAKLVPENKDAELSEPWL